MPLQANLVRPHLLTEHEREEMLALHTRYYENVTRGRFFADLAEKDWVIRLMDNEQLAGFSTQRIIALPVGGRLQHFVFSGDTIVERTYWREQALAGSFGHLMLRLLREHGEGDVFWFLVNRSHRTYRFLPVFFERFIPGPDAPEAPRLRTLLDAVASFRFGDAYDPRTGVIRAGPDTDRLRPDLSTPAARLHDDRFVMFFVQHNPRFEQGDGLACLAEIRPENFNRFAWRVIERTEPTWVE